jgi:uncharacterized protein YozE (UPF0346 family)
MEIKRIQGEVEFFSLIKGLDLVGRFAIFKGQEHALPKLHFKAKSFEEICDYLDIVEPLEALQIQSAKAKARSESITLDPKPQEKPGAKTLKNNNFRNAAFNDKRSSYEGVMKGCGKRKDFGIKSPDGSFPMRFCIDMECPDGLFRIWGAALPNVLAESRAQIGDKILVEQLAAPQEGMARHFAITKL